MIRSHGDPEPPGTGNTAGNTAADVGWLHPCPRSRQREPHGGDVSLDESGRARMRLRRGWLLLLMLMAMAIVLMMTAKRMMMTIRDDDGCGDDDGDEDDD